MMFDKPEVLSGSRYRYNVVPVIEPASQMKLWFVLFASGLNTGLLMACIIMSQAALFVLQIFRYRALSGR